MLRVPQTYLKYTLNPDIRSYRFENILQNASIDFGISLMKLFEGNTYKIYQEITEHRLKVNKVFTISPDPLQLYSSKFGKLVDIPIPSSHVEVQPISCRLLSKNCRKGMVSIINLFLVKLSILFKSLYEKVRLTGSQSTENQSKYVIIHCHGGGWVSQSSRLSKTLILIFR